MITGYFEVVAIRDHKPIHQSQLQFKRGEKILVVETAPTGWWKGEIGARKGLFPESYVSTPSGATSPLPASPLVPQQQQQQSPVPIVPSPQQSQTQPQPIAATSTTVNNSNSNNNSNNNSGNNTPLNIPQVNISSGSNSNNSSASSSANNTLRNTTNKPNTSNVSFSEPPSVTISLATISPIDSPSIESPANRSPRFNISKSDIENSTPLAKHSRKNSGPSKSISSLEFSNDDDDNGKSSIDGGTNAPPKKYSSATVNVNPYKESANPSSQQKIKSRTPLHQNGRLTVEDVNTQVPYYISRAIEPHVKQSFDELEFSTGDLVVVYNSKNVDSDWWVGRFKNIYGVFQKKCVEIIKDISPSPEPILSNKTVNNSTPVVSAPSPAAPTSAATPTSALPPTHPNSNHSTALPPSSSQQPPSTYNNTYNSYNNTYGSNNSNNNTVSSSRTEIKKAIAIGNYNSQFATYLSFKKGDILVLESKEGEFWRARIGGHIGLVSPNFIREIENQPVTAVATITNNNLPPQISPSYNNNINHSNNSNHSNHSNSSNHSNQINNTNNNSLPTKQNEEDKVQTPPTQHQDDDEVIAKKIRDSFVHFQSKEELLEAIQNLAIKFVKQSTVLKKELAQEQTKRLELEEELKIIKHKYNIN